MGKTCKQKAMEYVNWTAATGAAVAMAPIPIATTAGLITIEMGLIYWIARIYGERLTKEELAVFGSSLGVGSMVLKVGVMEALNVVPIAGWLLKAPLAASVVKGMGSVTINHFEDKYPGRHYVVDAEIENQRDGTSSNATRATDD